MPHLSRFALHVALLSTLAVVLFASPAAASDVAAAEALFVEGRALAQEGRYREACARFEESLRLSAAIGTKYNLADCYARTDRWATAWSLFREVEADARVREQAERAAAAHARADELAPTLPSIRIDVADPSDGIEVRRDDTVVGPAQWGLPIPVDAGEHVITVRAPGHVPWRWVVPIHAPGEAARVHVPALASSVEPPAPSVSSGRRTAAIVTGAAGVLAVGTGAVLLTMAVGRNHEADPHCDGSVCRDDTGVQLRHEARVLGDAATVAFVAGGALVAAGAWLWLTSPTAKSTARVGLGPGMIRFELSL